MLFQLQIKNCPADAVDALNEVLEETGALSITLQDQYDHPIFEPEQGTTELWPTLLIHALYAEKSIAEQAEQRLLTTSPALSVTLIPLPKQDWIDICQKNFQPQRFGEKLWVCPSWCTPSDADAVNVILDPGLAFGTGTHPTTALCLTWLEKNPPHHQKVIDYGCGSGILSLAALKLGATEVHAVDIEPQALAATLQNGAVNSLSSSQLIVSTPEKLKDKVDVILANILLAPLLQLKNHFCSLLKPGGVLVTSGILEQQIPELIDAYQDIFTSHTFQSEGWGLVVFALRSFTNGRITG